MIKNISYKTALEALKEGWLATRPCYKEDGIFFFYRPETEMDPEFIVNEVKSLPKAYKDTLIGVTFSKGAKISFSGYLCKKEKNNAILQGWYPSLEDALADDWMVWRL